MIQNYFLPAGLCLAGLLVRDAYELLKALGKLDSRNPAVFAVVFAGMCAMLASWPLLCPASHWSIALPAAARWFGLALVLVACVLALGGEDFWVYRQRTWLLQMRIALLPALIKVGLAGGERCGCQLHLPAAADDVSDFDRRAFRRIGK